jgi:hypothetical protein
MSNSSACILACLNQRKAHKYGIKMFECCEAKSNYVYNLEVYNGAHPTNSEHNVTFSVVDSLCDKIKGKGHCVYMDRWFSSPKIFHHLYAYKTKAVSTVRSNRKEIPKQAFSGEAKQVKKYHTYRITSWQSNGRTTMMLFS